MTHPWTLDDDAIRRTAAFIAGVQHSDGRIPWVHEGHTDPWDHVEAAMGLSVAGRHEEAAAAYRWLARNQNADGSWCRAYLGETVVDPVRDANFTAYVAVGVLHAVRATADGDLLDDLWPTVCAALDFVLGLQMPTGEVRWARGADGAVADEALLTGCASMYLSLRCALALAADLRELQPDWELGAALLGHALAGHPERFSPRERYAMDWYYPVLCGAVRERAARVRLTGDWDRFVVPGLGVRCVADRPWVTGAETCELVVALAALGETGRAARLFATVATLRHADGSYWTGYAYPSAQLWPDERPTWTAGAVLLADAMLKGELATHAVFSGRALPDPGRMEAVCGAAACAR